MPILTTTYPLMNSTFNVSQHTQKLIQEKMLVAAEICDLVLDEKEEWEALFKVCQIQLCYSLLENAPNLVPRWVHHPKENTESLILGRYNHND